MEGLVNHLLCMGHKFFLRARVRLQRLTDPIELATCGVDFELALVLFLSLSLSLSLLSQACQVWPEVRPGIHHFPSPQAARTATAADPGPVALP